MDKGDTKTNEMIVFVISETGWTLDYIRNMSFLDFIVVQNELMYIKARRDYQLMQGFASLMATTVNCNVGRGGRTYKAEDFIGSPPTRIKEGETDLWTIAKTEGIRLPKKGI